MSVQSIAGEDALRTAISSSPTNKLVVVDFYAEWCDACAHLSPHFDRLATSGKDSATFLKVDIDNCPSIAETYRISRLPTFVFVLGGQEVDRCGASLTELEAKVTQWSSPNQVTKNPVGMLSNMFGVGGGVTTSVNEKQFKGQGNRLGDKKTEAQDSQAQSESQSESSVGKKSGWFSSLSNWFATPPGDKTREEVAQGKMGVDLNLPHAPIQIRLVDSTKLQLRLNLHHSVSKIREFILAARPEYASKKFILLTSFPRKEIKDETISIAVAELGHAVVIQKLARL